jgi:SAM domain (Sterile alpha motif)
MQLIADWLEKLGMSEYAQRFAESRIDLSVLPDLTDQDLKDLGIVLGDRRKILRAIGEMGNARAPVQTPSISAPSLTPSLCCYRNFSRAPPSHCDVLGPCRLYGTLGADGP